MSAEPIPFTILYTVGLWGALSVLPRLFTFIQAQRTDAAGATLLLDLGETCIRGEWLCEATVGRGLLVAMDAMGYDLFYLDEADPLSGDGLTLDKLRATIVTPLLTDSASILLTKRARTGHSIVVGMVGETLGAEPYVAANLILHLRRGTADLHFREEPDRLHVFLSDRREPGGEIMLGRLDVTMRADGADEQPMAYRYQRLGVPARLRPDPSISGIIEFVESEARYFARKRP